MAKVDRSILQANDQNMGDFGDPNKLEASISHLADKIDGNDTETQSLKSDNTSNKSRLMALEADNTSNKNRIGTNEINIAYNEGRLVELLRNEQKASEVVDARMGFPVLRDKLESVDSQLAQKVTKGGVSVNDINKNLGKLDQTYMTDEFLQQMAGNSPINAVPANHSITTDKLVSKSVTPNNTSFIEGINLYDGSINNQGISVTGGSSVNLGGYATNSFFHPITSDIYVFKIARVSFYDASNNFISYSSITNSLEKLVLPSNAKFFKYAVNPNDVGNAFITQSANPITYPMYNKLAYKYFDEETFLSKYFDIINAYDNLSVNDAGISTDGTTNYQNYGGYGSDFIPVVGSIETRNIIRVAFYDKEKSFISYQNTITINGRLSIPSNAFYYKFAVSKENIIGAYVSTYKLKEQYIDYKNSNSNTAYSGYLGVQQFSLTVDDVILCFENITANQDIYTSVFENDFFSKCKALHDNYGLRILCVVFFKQDTSASFDLTQVPTKFKDEFEQNKHWLQFGFHSYASDVRYTDYSLPQPSGFVLNRSLFDDYTTTRNTMLNIVGTAWTDDHTCFHYYDGRKEDIKRLRETYGLSILDGIPYQIASRGYSYNIRGSELSKMIDEDVYKDEYTGVYYVLKDASVERVVGVLTTGNDYPVSDMTTFLNTYKKENIDYLQFETHEIYFDNQLCLDGYNALCDWCVKRGYSNKFPQARDFWNY